MSDVGREFYIKTDEGEFLFTCILHDAEKRILNCDEGSIELDWMEWLDQLSLGRITRVIKYE